MTVWISSYRNHIVYSSSYIAGIAFFVKTALTSGSTAWYLVNFFCALIFAWALKAEVFYMAMRLAMPPGDSGWPFLGCLPELLSGKSVKNFDKAKKYGRIYTINLLMTPTVFFIEDEDTAWVQAQERKGHTVPHKITHMSRLLGEEVIIFSSGAHHRRLRKMLEPAFSPKAIKDYAQLIDTTVQAVLMEWCKSKKYHSLMDISVLAMELFFVCAIGKVDKMLLEELDVLFTEWFKGFVTPIPVAYPGGILSKAHKARRSILDLLGKMIADFKEQNPPGSVGSTSTLMGRLCYGKDDEGKTLTNEQLVQNVLLIIFAGHDTTKGSFGSMFYYLYGNPHLFQLLAGEAKTFKEPLDVEELKAAPILNAFLAETWRLMAPVGAHTTEVVKDLEYKGFRIPKGAAVSFAMQLPHYDENKFRSPNEFKIERWLPKGHCLHDPNWYAEGVDYNTVSVKYRTFGGGPHMCLGMHFAKLEARIVITRLVQNYSLNIRNAKLMKFPLMHMNCDFKLDEQESSSLQ